MPITEAQKKQQKEYRERNKEAISERNKAYHESHRDKRYLTNAAWRKNNPDKVRATRARYCAAQKATKPPKLSKQEEFYSLFGANPDLNKIDSRQRTILEMYYGLNGNTPQSDPKIAQFFHTTRQNINLQRLQALKILQQ